MVKLFCAIVDVAGAAFPVDIDSKEAVRDLKKAVKAEKAATIACDAKDLRLFLAKTDKGRGRWLTEFEVQNGVADISGLKMLDVTEAPLDMAGFNEENVRFTITKELIKAKKTPVHVLVEPPEPPREWWLVTGSVVDALGSTGIRSNLYWIATLCIGYYDPTRRVGNENGAFSYEGKNLCFHVLFESQYAAQMFENNLALGTRTLHSPLNKHEVETRISRANGMPNDLKRIFHLDYDSNDSESFQSTSSSESLTTVAYFLEPSTKEFQFQRIEHEKIFPSCVKAECLYLVSKKECSDHEREFGKYDRDPNNRLALSRDMYGWYDGVSVDVPIVNMLPGNVEEHPSIGSRRKVDVFVKVVDVRYADLVFSRLRDGSTTTTDPLMMKTFVHVENPDTFCFCMMWKYNDNAKRVIDFFDTNRAMIEWKNKSRNIYC